MSDYLAHAILTELTVDHKGFRKDANATKIVRMRYTDISVSDLKAVGNKLSADLLHRGFEGKITCSTKIDYLGWRTGHSVDIGDHVKLYDYQEYDSWYGKVADDLPYRDDTVLEMADFYIYKYEDKPTKGKANEDNSHCFYDCIKTLFVDNKVRNIKGPVGFKRRFGILKDEGVDISLMPKIEKELGIQINVIGDHTYTSTKTEVVRRIKLLLKDGHYSIVKDNRKIPVGWSLKERIPLAFINKDNKMICYDGEKVFEMKKSEFYKERSLLGLSKYVLISGKGQKIETVKDLMKVHNKFCENADELKEATGNKLNLYKTGTAKLTADKLIYQLTKTHNFDIEPVELDESIWIEKCYTGGVIKTYDKGMKFGKLHKYDYCSKYPDIMRSSNTFPIKRGEFLIADDETKNKPYLPKGIFRCEVAQGSTLFVYNKYNYYTNSELNCAKHILNLKFTFIEDGQPNFLYYAKDKCIKMSELFGPFVDQVFPLKQQGVEVAKAVLTFPWGSVCEKYKAKHYKKCDSDNKKKSISIGDSEYVKCIKTISDDYIKVETTDVKVLYKGEFPRLLPFITSIGREHIYTLLHDKMDHVKLILTDGFLVTDTLFPKIKKQGAELGQLVYEGYYENLKIGNVNSSYKNDFKFVPYK